MSLTNFQRKKKEILRLLSEPEYDDASPKGSVDAEIRDFIDEINHIEGLVTTSSCSGRISVFLEGQKHDSQQTVGESEERTNYASQGGKGGGGRWVYVSHQPVSSIGDIENGKTSLMGLFNLRPRASASEMNGNCRFVHLKFEPMILHILVATLPEAQKVLAAAQQAGFRESGIGSVQGESGPVMVAVRTTGLAFDNIVGMLNDAGSEGQEDLCALVDEEYLQLLVEMTNDKFNVNTERTQKFRKLLLEAVDTKAKDDGWEDADVRRQRKRAEGLQRQEKLRQLEKLSQEAQTTDENTDAV